MLSEHAAISEGKAKINVTLDTNCIIDLEGCRDAAPDIRALILMHEEQKINLRVGAFSASEGKLGGKPDSDFAEFQQKIAKVGLGDIEVLKVPIGRLGMIFLGEFLLGDKQIEDVERRIHEILFPEIDFAYKDFCTRNGLDPNSGEINSRWRNKRCDVLSLLSHIHHGSGIFVTSDRNFRKTTKMKALIDLGGGEILTPKGAVVRLTSASKSS